MYCLKYEAGKWNYKDELLGLSYRIPEKWEAEFRKTPEIPALKGENDIREAVKNPKYGCALGEIIDTKKAKTVSILVSDATRAVPTARLLAHVVEALVDGGITYENIY